MDLSAIWIALFKEGGCGSSFNQANIIAMFISIAATIGSQIIRRMARTLKSKRWTMFDPNNFWVLVLMISGDKFKCWKDAVFHNRWRDFIQE
jgi:hypothetical protein